MSVLLLVLLNRMTVISIFFILYDQLIFNKFVSSLCYHSNGLAKTVALISFLSLVMLMSVLGNLLVMVAVCKDRQLRSETSHLRPLLSTYLSSQGKTSLFSISFVQLKSTVMTRVWGNSYWMVIFLVLQSLNIIWMAGIAFYVVSSQSAIFKITAFVCFY